MTVLHQSNMCAMPKPPKAVHTEEGKSRGQHPVGKLQLYEILYNLNQGFEQVLGQLHQLEKLGLGHHPWKALRVSVEENRAEVNFELVERLAEREERDWTYFGRLSNEREKKLRDPQDARIEADGLRQRQKKRRSQRSGTSQQWPACCRVHTLVNPASLCAGDLPAAQCSTLSAMDILKMLAELRAEREQIEEAIIVLERIAHGRGKRRGRPPSG
jgi:hypothetical protein